MDEPKNRTIAVGLTADDGPCAIALSLTYGTSTTMARLDPRNARHYASLLLICADFVEQTARDGGEAGR